MPHMPQICHRGQKRNRFFLFNFLQRQPWELIGDNFNEPRDPAVKADREWAMHIHEHGDQVRDTAQLVRLMSRGRLSAVVPESLVRLPPWQAVPQVFSSWYWRQLRFPFDSPLLPTGPKLTVSFGKPIPCGGGGGGGKTLFHSIWPPPFSADYFVG
jgi:hypothetical protein